MTDLLTQAIASIRAPYKDMEEAALAKLREQARPAGSLGVLEEISARLASIAGTLDVRLEKKIIVTCAGDHGIVEEGVSLFPAEVTPAMVYNFVKGGASVNVIARHAGAKVVVADLGVNHEFEPSLPIFHKKVRMGTANFAVGPAMTREEAAKSIEAGIEILDELIDAGDVDILGTGDMGIGNTSPSSAIIAAFSGLPVADVVGRGTGIDDEALSKKVDAIERGLAFNKPDASDPLDVLAKVGGCEIGGLAGLVIGAASHGIPVVCDGLISTAGALIACELAPLAREYLFCSHNSVEKGHQFMHERLKRRPLLDLDLRLGEGTGAAVAMEILDLSTRVLADIKSFEEVAIADAQE
ncbi:MAG: nicotinate-nucleotide--dimethylbenzimidazole phosphoribosyltransferase [Kiritimatiellia bacterium]|jgi:nicotinate-nucleotide--dimethylbenzimidazole phosphoribosyltransferase|nr:nicotinate-nucleotide--dimethylbenzimidazole phosphoribosyltransferase [Kiritimatiellia bacterium]